VLWPANFWTKCPEKAALVSALSYHHRLDVANLRSAVGREVGAPFCIPLRPGGASARLIADSRWGDNYVALIAGTKYRRSHYLAEQMA
jgi:hypothetical protein